MSQAGGTRLRREPWRYVVRGVVSLGLVAAALVWFSFAAFLLILKCDDVCSGGQSDWWGYWAQFWLAAAGSLLGAIALVLGFTRYRTQYRTVAGAAAGCALTWSLWVLGGSGSF